MKTVVRLPNWVGDTLLALPAIEALGDLPREEIVLAGRDLPLLLTRHLLPSAARLTLGHRGLSPAWLRDAAQLRRLGAHRGLLFAPSFSSALWLRIGGVPARIGWPEQGRGFLLTQVVPRAPRGARHLAEEFADLAIPSVGAPAPDFDLLTRTGERVRLADFRMRKPVVVIFAVANSLSWLSVAPSSSSAMPRWS